MSTEQIYHEDQYLTELPAMVTKVVRPGRPGVLQVQLNHTIFYPQGGGQPSDQGEIKTESGTLNVKLVQNTETGILHEGAIIKGTISEGEAATAIIKWSRRLKYMRVHAAGHLLHDVLMETVEGLTPIRGNHGDKAFLEYAGSIDPAVIPLIAEKLRAEIAAKLPIKTHEVTRDELLAMEIGVPSNLPTNKALRVIQIGNHTPMPDGGVHVASTGEIGYVVIHNISNADGRTTIRYGVANRTESQTGRLA